LPLMHSRFRGVYCRVFRHSERYRRHRNTCQRSQSRILPVANRPESLGRAIEIPVKYREMPDACGQNAALRTPDNLGTDGFTGSNRPESLGHATEIPVKYREMPDASGQKAALRTPSNLGTDGFTGCKPADPVERSYVLKSPGTGKSADLPGSHRQGERLCKPNGSPQTRPPNT
jgi:hypothetical protein